MSTITLDKKILKSNRRFGKALVDMVDEELRKCSPHHVLELEVRVIERQDKPIAQIMPEEKWHDLVTKRRKRSWIDRIERIANNNKVLRLAVRISFILLFATIILILSQIII